MAEETVTYYPGDTVTLKVQVEHRANFVSMEAVLKGANPDRNGGTGAERRRSTTERGAKGSLSASRHLMYRTATPPSAVSAHGFDA